MPLNERIKAARVKAGLTQAQLARMCGIAAPSLNQLECGRTKTMKHETAKALASALGVSEGWLAFGEGELGHKETKNQQFISTTEQRLLDAFRTFKQTEQRLILEIVEALEAKRT